MMIELYLKGKQNKNKECNAIGQYDLNTNHLIVKKGSSIAPKFNENCKFTKSVINSRNNKELVKNNIVLKDIEFKSPSTAAQFVVGSIVNGKNRWLTSQGITLNEFLKSV